MAFPSFMGAPRTLARDAFAAPPVPNRTLVSGFALDTQRFGNWCWAAVTQAVERVRGTDVEQADIASDHVGRGQAGRSCITFDPADTTTRICDVNSCESSCNAMHSLRIILTERGLLAQFVQHPLDYDAFKAEVAAGRPVPCRIAWKDGGGHFVCVAGCSDDGGSERFVIVYDPLNPDIDAGPADRVELRFEDFRDRFRSGASEGTLDRIYLVR